MMWRIPFTHARGELEKLLLCFTLPHNLRPVSYIEAPDVTLGSEASSPIISPPKRTSSCLCRRGDRHHDACAMQGSAGIVLRLTMALAYLGTGKRSLGLAFFTGYRAPELTRTISPSIRCFNVQSALRMVLPPRSQPKSRSGGRLGGNSITSFAHWLVTSSATTRRL